MFCKFKKHVINSECLNPSPVVKWRDTDIVKPPNQSINKEPINVVTTRPSSESDLLNFLEKEQNASQFSYESAAKKEPNLREKRRDRYRRQSIDFNQEIINYTKTKTDEKLIKTAIAKNEFLKNIWKGHILEAIIAGMYSRKVEPEETLIEQGEAGDHLFISAQGKFSIIIDQKLYDTFENCRVFGELAILYNNPRSATIKALTSGLVWILKRDVYVRIIRKATITEEEASLSFLKNVDLFKEASQNKLHAIVGLFDVKFFKSNTEIVRQGEKGEDFFIVKSGTASVTIKGQGKVATLSRGKYFGERALLEKELRAATVTADAPGVECLVLSRQDFETYLGDLPTFIKTQDVEKRKSSNIANEYSNLELKDLKVIKTIGSGGFGTVLLVLNKKEPKQKFALKYMSKEVIFKNKLTNQVYNERNIQKACNCIFIIRLYRTMDDEENLYYLLECCMNGDLWSLMKRQKRRHFSEEAARFIAASILEALIYLHERFYVFLDLKPENVLVDDRGYIKLCDFGNALRLENDEKCFALSGTHEYMAPEIFLSTGHDRGADYWAFGIFIFELLVGKTPFASESNKHTETFIVKGIDNVVFPSHVTKDAKHIIRNLCRTNMVKRLGYQRNGSDAIREHNWFGNFNWEKLRSGKFKSPFVRK